MIDSDFIRRVAKAVNELTLKVTTPQFIQSQPFELHGRIATFDILQQDERGESKTLLPIMILGLPVVTDNAVPSGQLWVVEPRSNKHAVVSLR